jgi:hypothetical protein
MLILYSWVWFGLFVHPFSHACNNGHVNYIQVLQFMYHNRTYNIWTSTQYNIINNSKKFKDQLKVESGKTVIHTPVGTTACSLMAIYRTKSDHVLHSNSRRYVSVHSHEFTLCCLLRICRFYPYVEYTAIWCRQRVLRCQFVVEVVMMY